jgi:hypothetical protein
MWAGSGLRLNKQTLPPSLSDLVEWRRTISFTRTPRKRSKQRLLCPAAAAAATPTNHYALISFIESL